MMGHSKSNKITSNAHIKIPSRNPTSKTLENIGIDQSCLSANLIQQKRNYQVRQEGKTSSKHMFKSVTLNQIEQAP
jgi:hypothetical protein